MEKDSKSLAFKMWSQASFRMTNQDFLRDLHEPKEGKAKGGSGYDDSKDDHRLFGFRDGFSVRYGLGG